MELVVHPISGSHTPERVLRALAARARRQGLAPPAALVGDWFGASAVLAPSVRVRPVAPQPDGTVPADRAQAVPSRLPQVHRSTGVPDGAVGGGWFGYLGYGLTDPGRAGQHRALPPAAWGWCDHVLRRDVEGQWWLEALVDDDAGLPADWVAEFEALVSAPAPRPRHWWAAAPTIPPSSQHTKAVRGGVEAIADGEIFQANICTAFEVDFSGDPLDVFTAGTERLRPARAAYLAGEWGAVVSLSPELFLARDGADPSGSAHVRSAPIKGTLPRRDAGDDVNAERLRRSVKDVAENVMIVDLVRNDLGRVCIPGSITVPDLLDVQPHPGVWHLVSEVHGRLRPGMNDADLLAAAFPPGSVTGTPKVRALELIDELESTPREVYCGAVGLVSPVAGMELNVAIRTLEFHPSTRADTSTDGAFRLGVGGGITADSDPEHEWQECLTKAAPLLDLLGAPHE